MLKYLSINNIAVVPSARMELGGGLTVLSGETGAGKSILVDSLGLLLGVRASTDLIRTGAEQAVVEGVFEADAAAAFLAAHGLPADEDGQLVLRRELSAAGKSRATLNGALVPVALLRELAPELAMIHGQHEPQGLLDPATHLHILDRHAGLQADTAQVADLFRRHHQAASALEAARRDRREAERRRDTLEFQVAEIDRAGLRAGEVEDLRREKALLANAERLALLSGQAYGLLYEDEAAALTQLGQVWRKLEELVSVDDRLRPHLDGRGTVRAVLQDLALTLRDYRDGLAFHPGRLDEVEERLAVIQRLQRKYGEDEAEVLAYAETCRAELQALNGAGEREAELEGECAALAGAFAKAALALSERRRRAAATLEKEVEQELRLLAMEKTRFRVRFAPVQVAADGGAPSSWTEAGLETAEFDLSPNPGEELRPLSRVASGGELSRVLLALNSVASAEGAARTLVFDEVDTGIGGRVAEVVGRKLKDMSRHHQVLCVTHLPQIASMADNHFVVSKTIQGGRTLAGLRALDAAARVEEVARMLAGETVTEAARQHAREMVKQSLRS